MCGGGGSLGKVEWGGGVRGDGGLSHTLCLLAICWGFIMVVRVSVRVRRGGGGL